ncbi:hypothetical protein V5799_010014, partial [Amblyomma americanum]
MVSTASSSSGFDERLNGDAGDYTPVAGRRHICLPHRPVEQVPVQAAGNRCDRRQTSTERKVTFLSLSVSAVMEAEGDRFKIISESQNSEVFRVFSYKGDSVLKVQQLDSTPGSLDNLLSKIKIASRLTELRKMQDYSTSGFLELRREGDRFKKIAEGEDSEVFHVFTYKGDSVLKVQQIDSTPESLDRLLSKITIASDGDPCIPYPQLESVLQLWSVLQQIALSLAVAEEALEFEHRALRLGHVLVKNTHEQSSHFFVGGRSFAVNTWGVE